jgi:hypothetical protein
MTLPVYPNSISLNQIQAEFGGATPAFLLSQYYAGGGRVSSGLIGYPLGVATAIPSSGTISLGNFSGATRRVIVTVTISATTTNYLANTAKVTGYVAGITDVTFVIDSGVVVGSSSVGSYAFTVDTSWNAGDTVRVTNNGTIIGASGNGGTGGNYDVQTNGYAGSAGGPAVLVQRTVTAWTNTSGTTGGGGGGGGGGVGGAAGGGTKDGSGGGGGGGGRGYFSGSGGAGGSSGGTAYPGSAGTAGSSSSAGAGGAKGGFVDSTATAGGAGGALGSAGTTAANDPSNTWFGGAGGAAGACLVGRSYVNAGTGISGGTVAGAQSG